MHPCKIIFQAAQQQSTTGTPGICRITAEEAIGQPFNKWVRDTFTNHDVLHPGDIISNEALFCFDEASMLLQQKTGRDKPQRFRTYSHIVTAAGEWHCLTKADKRFMVELITTQNPRLVCLTDSGQKHILFKNSPPMWQLDDSHIVPDVPMFLHLHGHMIRLLELGFSQTEIQTGNYYHARILKAGLGAWQQYEQEIKSLRGQPIFDFAAWLMFTTKSE